MRWFGRRRRPALVAYQDPVDRRFRFFGSRRHLAGLPYDLPKDDQEISRLDFQHYVLRYAFKGNYLAPLVDPRDILDVGCGSGRWGQEIALVFPTANVIGLDVVPPPADANPAESTRPPNYAFVPGNVLEGLPFADASFDYVHQRLLIGALPADQWPRVVAELRRVARPGGWVELAEGHIRVDSGGRALQTLGDWVYTLTSRRGIDPSMYQHIGQLLRGAGLANVEQHAIRLPVGRKYGRLGYLMEANMFALYDALKGPLFGTGVTTPDVYARTIEEAGIEIARGKCSANFCVAYGQRPMDM
ncbi:MAG TPA: class I SAM-dependent methyltransferase [Ktedonobacterales bacterium]